ncbi:MAG: PEP-CTERM sorting domain-containing protein [Leptolyngbya sp. SIOISBB]|nr:PEP-CTERM sorting domain-containing protein [Leptolyngbya sp. SIOISBB]
MSKFAVATGLATGALVSSFATGNAFAVGFGFETDYFENASPKGDILLKSVTIGDEIIEDFSFVNSAVIDFNDAFDGGNTGAASADKGDNATGGVVQENLSEMDGDVVVANLSTNNLNHIIDTEDEGAFTIDLQFGKSIDNLLIWERGKNSDLGIVALDAAGNEIGEKLTITRNMWLDAGYSIDTTEIDEAQEVGSLGISIFDDLGVESGAVDSIRFFSESGFNGPDWKFVGTDAARVPEPAFILGFTLVGGALAWQKRAKAA